MTSKERVTNSLNHITTDKIVIDFGSTPVTGIHVLAVQGLRNYYGLDNHPIKVTEPYQMLGEIEEDLMTAMGVDLIGLSPKNNMFGIAQENWKEFKTFWGQVVLVPKNFNTTIDPNGDLLIYPEGDTTISACAKMPKSSYFFDAIIRQQPIEEDKLNPDDNLEDFSYFTDKDIEYWKSQLTKIKNTDKAVIANIGGTGLGDIALVPAMFLKSPKGIRDIAEWYMSTIMRSDYIHTIFDKQTDIAIENLKQVFAIFDNKIDVLFECGTDFGTQDSTFCSPETFNELWKPYYKKINNWIHTNTKWKTFKHCCGAVEPFMSLFIDSGFDIINPVQINAKGMDTKHLKDTYGEKLVFWGGGVDTQKTLPFGTPTEVEKQVLQQCKILSKNGGFIFNAVHNIQANTPVENIVAMINSVKKINGE